MMACGYPVSDCCLTASWTTLFSWGAKGTALVLVKVNGFPTSVYGLIQTSMGPTFVWNAFRLSYSSDCRSAWDHGGPSSLRTTRNETTFSCLVVPLFASLSRINRVGYGCLDALPTQPRLIVPRSDLEHLPVYLSRFPIDWLKIFTLNV